MYSRSIELTAEKWPLCSPSNRTDFVILAALQNNARLSNKELAARVGLAPSSCLERVRRLREEGVLTGYRAIVEPRALGIAMQALVFVTLARHARQQVKSFRQHALSLPETIAVYHVAGQHDFLVHVGVRDANHLRDLAMDAFTSRTGGGAHRDAPHLRARPQAGAAGARRDGAAPAGAEALRPGHVSAAGRA